MPKATKTKHTPGPWTIEPIFGEDDLSIVLDYEASGEGNPVMIGHATACEHDGHIPRTPAEAEANARLIAAAPDLLAALEGVVRRAKLIEDHAYGVWRIESSIDGVIAQAREAIDRATNPKETP